MTKRLHVILQDAEYLEIQRLARSRQMSVLDWVRRALAAARQREEIADVDKNLAGIRAAARHNFPSGDVEVILAQIERGYTS